MRPLTSTLVAVLLMLFGAYASAQFGFRGRASGSPRFAPATLPDRDFVVCRIMYTSDRREPNGAGWWTDYPLGEINLSTRLGELTKTPVSKDKTGQPNHWVVQLTDDELFKCPLTVASDVGTAYFSPEEVERLRTYLLKGGFLWVDDFWGWAAWDQWVTEISKVLPPSEYVIEDIPIDDPIFRTQFVVEAFPQISNIRFWRATGGASTSERGAESAEPHFRAIRDQHGRIMVIMSHNTDIADSWEREGEDPGYFYRFSPNGYAVGINVVLHAMIY